MAVAGGRKDRRGRAGIKIKRMQTSRAGVSDPPSGSG